MGQDQARRMADQQRQQQQQQLWQQQRQQTRQADQFSQHASQHRRHEQHRQAHAAHDTRQHAEQQRQRSAAAYQAEQQRLRQGHAAQPQVPDQRLAAPSDQGPYAVEQQQQASQPPSDTGSDNASALSPGYWEGAADDPPEAGPPDDTAPLGWLARLQRLIRVSGTAYAVNLRSESRSRGAVQVLAFRVERYDQLGNRLDPVAVELRGKSLEGQISDGTQVIVTGRWRRGGLFVARSVYNVDARAELGSRRARWALLAAPVLAVAAVAAVVAFPFVRNAVGRADSSSPPPPVNPGSSESARSTPVGGAHRDSSKDVAMVEVPTAAAAGSARRAVALLASAGLRPERRDESSDVVASGDVIRLEPEPGARVPVGSSVLVVSSTGAGLVPVPRIEDLPAESSAAVAALQQLGFGVTVSYRPDAIVPAGRLIALSPSPGTRVAQGSQVGLVVSTGDAGPNGHSPPHSSPSITVPHASPSDHSAQPTSPTPIVSTPPTPPSGTATITAPGSAP